MTKTNLLSVLLFSYFALFLFNTFWPVPAARYLMVIALAGIHFLAFGAMKRASKIISVSLTVCGALLLLTTGAKADDWVKGWLNNMPIICLLMSVAMFTIPLYFEPYHEVLSRGVARWVKSPFQFYTLALGITAILASLLNLASFPFVHDLLAGPAAHYRRDLIAKALLRGAAVNMLWSPAFLTVAVVLQYSAVSWFEILPAGVTLACAVLLIALAFGAVEFRGDRQDRTQAGEGAANDASAMILLKLFLQLAILIVFIAMVQYFTHQSALVIVPLVSVAGPLLLALVFSRFTVYKARVREYFLTTLPNSYREAILFTSFGFFGYALSLSAIKNYIPLAIQYLGFETPLTLIPLLTFLTAFPCLFGVHPLITISTVAITLPPGSVALTQIQMAGALMLGYVCYANVSPFSGVNLVIMGLTHDPIMTAVWRNLFFTVVIVGVATLILTYLPF